MRVCLYGCGNRCKILLKLIERSNIELVGIVDSNQSRWGEKVGHVVVSSPECLRKDSNTYVCVTFFGENDYEPIWTQLKEDFDVDERKILSFQGLIRIIYNQIICIPTISIDNNKEVQTIFDGSWIFGVGGVESWIETTVCELIRRGKPIKLLTTKEQTKKFVDNEECLIDYSVERSREFNVEDVKKSVDILIENLPCTLVFSRADEVLLAASLIKCCYPEFIRIITVVHGSCDGLVRDVCGYDDVTEKYFCVSNATKNALLNLNVNPEKCELINSPIIYQPIENKYYSLKKTEPIRLGYAGRIVTFHKRADLLLDLIELLERWNVNYIFEIAGEGNYVSELLAYIIDNNLTEKIKYLGVLQREEVFKFWETKDISINVSDSEGRPFSNIEAMLCGAVPVVTATKGILDDVEDGITGYVVNIGDINSMANKINYLADNRFLLKKIGKAAQDSMLEKTDIEKYVEIWNQTLMSKGC